MEYPFVYHVLLEVQCLCCIRREIVVCLVCDARDEKQKRMHLVRLLTNFLFKEDRQTRRTEKANEEKGS